MVKINRYSIETKGIKHICKSPSAWGGEKGTGRLLPLVYFLKPKWMKQSDFESIIKGITIDFPINKEFSKD